MWGRAGAEGEGDVFYKLGQVYDHVEEGCSKKAASSERQYVTALSREVAAPFFIPHTVGGVFYNCFSNNEKWPTILHANSLILDNP